MYTKSLFLFIFAAASHAATITVCASGCTYTNFQTALNAAVGGDIIELTAGEVFEGAFVVPWRSGGGRVEVRSSRWAELPAQGNRVGSAQAALMPKLQPSSNTATVLTFGPTEFDITLNTTTDTITYGGSPVIANNDPIACWYDFNSAPIPQNERYYAINATATTFQLAALPGGSAVDFSGTTTATRFRCALARAPIGWTFTGIEFRKKPGQDSLYTLVDVGTVEATSRYALPDDIIFDRVYIHGYPDEYGPRQCLWPNARGFTLVDSTIEYCIKEGDESKALTFTQWSGPGVVRNNYIQGGSIGILAGGDFVRIQGLVNGDTGGLTFTGNHVTRPMSWHYLTGTGGVGAPVGACTDGNYYLRTSNGVLYVCSSSTWGLAPACTDGEYFRRTDVTQNCASGACNVCASGVYTTGSVYRGSSYNVKNLLEFKSIMNTVVSGNTFATNWPEAQGGIGLLVLSLVDQYNANGWVRGQNIRFTENTLYNSTSGMRMSTEGSTIFGQQSSRIQIQNNLLYKIGATDYPSISSNAPQPQSYSGPCNDCLVDHNTISTDVTGGYAAGFDTAALTRFRLSNGIGYTGQYGLAYDGGSPCTTYLPSPSGLFSDVLINPDASSGGAPACATVFNFVPHATTMFTSTSDFRLQSTSPYSAKCSTGCGFTATDGKDLGADIDMVDTAIGGSVSGAPWLGGSVVVSAGSTRAILRYTAPSTSACTVKLYTDVARTTLSADTASGGDQLDTRTGSVTSGTSRQFVLGTVSALSASTTYWAVITCGTSTALSVVQTLPAGSGSFTVTTTYPSARTGEYSSSADMSSPTAISSSATHDVPVPSGTVRYYRPTGGQIIALVNR